MRAAATTAAVLAAAPSALPDGRSRSPPAEKSSLAFVLRLALLHEGCHSFPVIFREPRLTLQVAFKVELCVKRIPSGRLDGFLDEAGAFGRPGGEQTSHGGGFVH